MGFSVLAQAQDSRAEGEESSDQTEESEDAYRRRMELEGARNHDTYTDTSYTSQAPQEEIDKLPEESQKNIRKQITDIIIENDQWEPSDVLDDYPYEPTDAAQKDPILREQEEEAWAEQVDKYHEREAAAFGATRPPMPGSDQQQAGAESSGNGEQSGEPGGKNGGPGQDGEQSEKGGSDSAGSYEPYQSGSQNDEDGISTAGVEESALDFLRGQRGQQQGQSPDLAGGDSAQQGPASDPADSGDAQPDQAPSLADSGSEQTQDSEGQTNGEPDSQERAPDGSLPIDQLEQLRGVAGTEPASGQPSNEQPQTESSPEQPENTETQEASEQLAQASQAAQQSEAENQEQEQQASLELNLDTPGIIAIRDLNKLEGVEESEEDQNP